MECKAEPSHVMNLTDVSIDLTRMECKDVIEVVQDMLKKYRFNQNGM